LESTCRFTPRLTRLDVRQGKARTEGVAQIEELEPTAGLSPASYRGG